MFAGSGSGAGERCSRISVTESRRRGVTFVYLRKTSHLSCVLWLFRPAFTQHPSCTMGRQYLMLRSPFISVRQAQNCPCLKFRHDPNHVRRRVQANHTAWHAQCAHHSTVMSPVFYEIVSLLCISSCPLPFQSSCVCLSVLNSLQPGMKRVKFISLGVDLTLLVALKLVDLLSAEY